MPVALESDGLERYPQEIEAAVYFCCLGAVQNISKYADASTARSVWPTGPARSRSR